MPTAYAPLGRERGSRSSASVPSSIAGLLIAAGLLLLLNSAAFPSTAAAAAADDDFDQRLQALERVLHIDSVAGGEGDVADATCHARANTGYAGDGALVGGLGKPGFHLAGASECCTACQAHARSVQDALSCSCTHSHTYPCAHGCAAHFLARSHSCRERRRGWQWNRLGRRRATRHARVRQRW